MTTPTPRFTIHPINPLTDYPTLTTLSLLAIESNPLHYLTFRPSANIPYQTIFDYHRKTKVELHGEGIVVQTFKVVDHEAGGKIVGFASWVFDCSWPRVENVEVPEGMDGRFLNAFRDEVRGLVEEVILGENCVELHLMRVPPSHQGQGLGSLLLNWRLSEARRQGKKVFLMASPQGRGLYLKWGFEVVGEVKLRIAEFLDEEELRVWEGKRNEIQRKREEVYVQSLMVWDPVEEWKRVEK